MSESSEQAAWEKQFTRRDVLLKGAAAGGALAASGVLARAASARPTAAWLAASRAATATLFVALTFSGRGSKEWGERLGRWLGSSDAIGDVQLRFIEGPGPVCLSPTFRASSEPGTMPLARGAIELQGASG